MAAQYRTALFLFRRDLRLDDNTGLLRALDRAEQVVTAFVFDPRQQSDANPYFGAHAFQFLLESLEDLGRALADTGGRLHRFHGLPHEVVERLAGELDLDALFVNRDYTPFSRKRDGELAEVCAEHRIHFEAVEDLLLHEPGRVLTGAGEPYQVFTPFFRKASGREVRNPRRFTTGPLDGKAIDWAEPEGYGTELLPASTDALAVRGGRSRALAILERLDEHEDYETARERPAEEDGTTRLSAHLKLGTVSAREVHRALRRELGAQAAPLLRQLWWRDFFTQLAWFNPHVFGGSFRREYDAVEWPGSPEAFEAWCAGRTGFPLVDAGMRQLAATGWMHNRVRMVVASFLTKDLEVDWRDGERWFARQLVDYDPAVNNGNWQWAASTGADAQPYFRIFNPWTQQRKFDPDGLYVKRWVPELEEVPAAALHRLEEERPGSIPDDYPRPIVEHRQASRRTRERFEVALDS